MPRWVTRIAVLAGVILAWEMGVRLYGNPQRFPYPSAVATALVRDLGSGRLVVAVVQSLSRVLLAFFFAAATGIVVGVAIAVFRPLDRALSPIIDSLRSIAPIVWIPMAVLWFGITGRAAIFIVAYAAVFPIILNTSEAVRRLDRRLFDAALTLGAGPATLVVRVILRGAMPTIIVGARVAMGFAWASIIAAELAMGIKLGEGAQISIGLGQLMVNTLYVERDLNGLVGYMLTIGLIAILIDLVMRQFHRLALPASAIP
jgi:ABC-type nitrate/sulfonate/bicarbonate transport system permease component